MASAHPVGFQLRETETLVGKRLVDGFAGRTVEFIKPLFERLRTARCLDCRLNWPSWPEAAYRGVGTFSNQAGVMSLSRTSA
jgi:hypothetical protein